jgi:hypothetical protein
MAMKFNLNSLKNIDWKNFFLEKGEKVGLGVAGALAFYFFVSCIWTWIASPSPTENAKKLVKQADDVTGKLNNPSNKPSASDKPAEPSFKLTEKALVSLDEAKVPGPVLSKLKPLKDKEFKGELFAAEVKKVLNKDEQNKFQNLVLDKASSLPDLAKYQVDHPELYAVGELFQNAQPSDNKRHQPPVLQPDEGTAKVVLAQLNVYIMQNFNDVWKVKVLDTTGTKNNSSNFQQSQLMNMQRNMPGGKGGMGGMGNRGAPGQPGQAPEDAGGALKSHWEELSKADPQNHRLAETMMPLRMTEVVAAFPYRRQLDKFKENLRLGSYAAVLNEASKKMDESTGQAFPNFRFLGVRLQRRIVDALGNPLEKNIADGGWVTIDLEQSYKPPLLLAGGRTQNEDDERLEAIGPDGLVMPRLLQARDNRYPAIESQLPGIRKTLDSLAQGKADATNTLPKEFDVGKVDIFKKGNNTNTTGNNSRMPPGMKSMTPRTDPRLQPPNKGGEPVPEANLPPEYVLVRVIDVTIKPGNIYEYRVQVRMANPNFGRTDVASPKYDKDEELESSDWFIIPDKVVVPPEMVYYVVDQMEVDGGPRKYQAPNRNLQSVKQDHQVAFQIHRWLENAAPPDKPQEYIPVGEWVVAERLIVGRGEYIGRTLRVEVPIWKDTQENYVIQSGIKDNRKVTGSEISFSHSPNESILVDFAGPEQVAVHGANKITENATTEVLILSYDGKLLAREGERDKADGERQNRLKEWRNRVKTVKEQPPPGGGNQPKGNTPNKPGGQGGGKN